MRAFAKSSKDIFMSDFAELILAVDTRDMERGQAILDSFARKAKTTEAATVKMADRIQDAARRAAVGLGAMAASFATMRTISAAINAARDFNAEIANTATLIAGTPQQIKELEEAARSMARTFGTDAASQVKGFYEALSAGSATVADAALVMDAANKLAVGGQTQVATAVDVLTTAMNVYTKEGLTAASASDALFVAALAGKTTIGELSEALGRVLPLAQNLGVSFDEVNAAVAALTKGGIATSEAVTGLRAAMTAVLGPSKEARDLAKKLGIDFSAAGLKAKGFSGFMADVVQKTGGSSEAMQKLFGSVEATTVALSMAGAAGGFMSEIMVQMAEKLGATQAAYDKVADSLSGRLNIATAQFSDLLLHLGMMILPPLVTLMEAAAAVATLVSDNLERISVYAAVAAAALVVSMAPAIIAATVAAGQFVIALVATRAALIRTGIGAVIILVGELIYQFLQATERVGGFGKMMSLIADVGVEAINKIGYAWDWLSNTGLAAASSLKAAFLAALNGIIGGFMEMTWAVAEGLNTLFNTDMFRGAAIGEVTQALARSTIAAEDAAVSYAAAASAAAVGWNRPLASVNALETAMTETADAEGEVVKAATEVGDGVTDAMDKAGGATKKTKEKIDEFKKALESAIDSAAGAFGDFVVNGLRDFKGFVNSVLDSFKRMVSQMIATAVSNPIKIAMGLIPAAPGAAATSTPGQAGGGALSGISGMFSNALGSFGSSGTLFGAAGLGGGSGFLGGLGSSISSGIGGIFNVSANIAAAGGGLAATLGALVAPLAAVAAVFSFFKTKTTQLDAGLRLTINGLETAVETFSRVKRTKFWGLSSSTRTTYAAASDSVADPISRAIGEMQAGIIETAGILGIGSAAFNTFAKQLQISTQGLSESDALAAVQKAILGLGDDFAALATGIGDFTRDGEGAMAALTRLSQALTAVNLMADTLGLTFRAVGLIGADMASQLSDAFGGLDALNTAVGNYYSKFYTEAERNATATRQAAEALAKLNASMPRSRDEYRAMVEAQDLTTESGRALFAALVSLSGVMDQVLPQVGSLTAAIAAIVGDVQTGLGAMITATQDAQSRALAAAEAWRETAKTLRRYIGDMRGRTSALTSASAALVFNEAQFRTLLAQALGGNLEAAGQLTGAADALISSAGENATTTQEAARAQAAVLAGLTQVADSADTTGSAMDALAALLGEQLTVLQAISDYLAAGGVDATHIQGLTDSLAALQGPIAGVGALDLTAQLAAPMATLGAGLASLAYAIQDDIKERAARAAADTSAQAAAQVEAARLAALAEADRRAAVAAAEAASEAAAREAARLAALVDPRAAWIAQGNEGPMPIGWNATGFAAGGDHKGGLRIVGENGPEPEATGPSRIFTASQTKAMLKGGNASGGFAEVVDELRNLRKQVEALQEQERQMQAQILSDGRRERKIIEAWEATGMPPARAAL